LYALCKTADFPSYAADLWKSAAGDYFLSIGLHWIDTNWELQSFITHCVHVTGDHTGTKFDFISLTGIAISIGKLVGKCLLDCLTPGVKPFAGVTDGGEIASVGETAMYTIPDH